MWERIITEEKASHPSWSSAITRNYGVVQNHFWYALIAPPFPPFPPQSSVFQGDVVGEFFPIFTRAMFPFVAKEAKNWVSGDWT